MTQHDKAIDALVPADDAAVAWQHVINVACGRDTLNGFPRSKDEKQRRLAEISEIARNQIAALPAKALDMEAARKIDFWLKEIKDCNGRMWNGSRVGYFGQIAKGVDELRALLTGNASSETEGGR